MLQKPVLIVMAAGMGSRYGGLKQVDPVGPNGQTIMDYSLYDAKRAGFERVLFVISPQMEADFPGDISERIGAHMDVRCAVQRLDDIPAEFSVPQGRVKPWGTGHAIRACRQLVDAPFAAINADDYYGVHAFAAIYGFLQSLVDAPGNPSEPAGSHRYAMVGYELAKTLSRRGYVARGICSIDADGMLTGIKERTHIVWSSDGPLYTEDEQTYHRLADDAVASMNMWGFSLDFMQALDSRFTPFLKRTLSDNPFKGEYFLPEVVGEILREGAGTVQVLRSTDRWYGVTYRQDRPVVEQAIREMTEQGLYPDKLW